jgi:hypothetical protein
MPLPDGMKGNPTRLILCYRVGRLETTRNQQTGFYRISIGIIGAKRNPGSNGRLSPLRRAPEQAFGIEQVFRPEFVLRPAAFARELDPQKVADFLVNTVPNHTRQFALAVLYVYFNAGLMRAFALKTHTRK